MKENCKIFFSIQTEMKYILIIVLLTRSKLIYFFSVAVFNQTQLVNALLPTWDQMQKANGSKIFRQPVPVSDQIPNYFDIVKKPMDLSTIHAKLTTRQYSTPREYVDDVWLMFDNAWLYNQPNTLVYRNCTYVSKSTRKSLSKTFSILTLEKLLCNLL